VRKAVREIPLDPPLSKGEAGAFDATDYPPFARQLRESGCRRCALADARTTIVVDRGDPAAGIAAIGEGPGEQEDLAGRAFVGRAGRVLDDLLRSVGLDPERHLLIANVVKCRPPANRVPHADEVAACFPYLRRQLELVRPHTILLLGATAFRHFVPAQKSFAMEREVGRRFALEAWPGIAFYALYHPAYLLRSPTKKPLALGHLERLREALKRSGQWPGSG
jgi:uracil-DNA glycosylase family 4